MLLYCGHGLVDELNKLCIFPVTGTQVKENVAMRGRIPPAPRHRSQMGRQLPSLPPSEPCPEEGSQPQLHLEIRELNDAQLREALEELQLETVRREGMAPPIGSPLDKWQVPAGGSDTDLDDGEGASKGEGWGPSKPAQ